ncbi:hypothetical protein GPECTOR_41g664 [Gonium pectorale]|uniref:Histone deacetylase domain-containing protein n=1 Tax=Gonium pectorale TaxID=33097 RepID=A0A150GBG7_GONPE|nr:hypothetical protein GPECTOR_41g664 [Gonium pectorale]|eukprot:KXZ46700.1 hypothetical protein GPECTOR_41g664 [Gonium pectorale]
MGRLKEPTLVDDSTYLAPGSFTDCARSVGAILDLLDRLLGAGGGSGSSSGKGGGGGGQPSGAATGVGAGAGLPSAGFALVRPPGHHVLPGRPMGFGVFNAVAIAARYARERHGMERILIVDFDVHHGNGTMEVFYDDCRTLYISTHQAGLWPYTGKARETGAADGAGATVNVPLPGGSGDEAMREAWRRVVLPAAERFGPQLLLVSAGYDAHWRDPLAGMQITAAGYHWLALILEGGYDGLSLAESVEASVEGLMGRPAPSAAPPPPRALHEEPCSKVDKALQGVKGRERARTEGGGPGRW